MAIKMTIDGNTVGFEVPREGTDKAKWIADRKTSGIFAKHPKQDELLNQAWDLLHPKVAEEPKKK